MHHFQAFNCCRFNHAALCKKQWNCRELNVCRFGYNSNTSTWEIIVDHVSQLTVYIYGFWHVTTVLSTAVPQTGWRKRTRSLFPRVHLQITFITYANVINMGEKKEQERTIELKEKLFFVQEDYSHMQPLSLVAWKSFSCYFCDSWIDFFLILLLKNNKKNNNQGTIIYHFLLNWWCIFFIPSYFIWSNLIYITSPKTQGCHMMSR